MAKKTLLWIIKTAVSGLIAFLILTLFSALYYNVPVHSDSPDGATDYVWETNKFYSRATEGFAWGKTNNEGYLNPYDYTPETEVDILLIGSSHTEAYMVDMDNSTAGALKKLMPDSSIYNIGTSSHHFMVCADNLSTAVNKYKPSQYVVMETYSLAFSEEELRQAIAEEVPHLESRSDGLIGLLQKNPFLRLLYLQASNYTGGVNDSAPVASAPKETASEEVYNQFFEKLAESVGQSEAKLVIFYHPHLVLNSDGSAYAKNEPELSELFSRLCQQNGIIYIDMTDTFLKEYEESSVLPHGFTNTSIGSGHLNKHGHAMIAKELYNAFKEGE